MKKNMIAAGLMAAAATASHAQGGNVSVYGLIDTGVEYVTNVGAGGDNLTRMPTLTGTLPSRLGFRGTEDLGGGLKAVFTLENGLAPDAGTQAQGGRLFGRQAFVGLSGDWGTVSIGRQYTMLFWSILDSDILGPNIYGSGGLDSYIPNARADNAVAYRGTFSGLTLGATYSFGRDAVNAGPSPAGTNCAGENAADSKACREWSLMAKYDTAGWGVAAAYDRINGGPGAFAGLTSGGLGDSRATINGYVKFGQAKLGGGVIRRSNEASAAPRSDLYFIGGAYPVIPEITVEVELFRLDTKGNANDATLFAVRGLYHLSKRTAAYVTAGHVSNGGTLNLSVSGGAAGSNPVAGGSQTGLMVGMRHFF
ncbi:porin [Pseudoduganella namucuonensis]|uniref:Outer membrane protein (Porin) n=1 Tax=Pseudoduganella namucuonensis TaxID=1035707 RepID=A0A1I7G4S7_9BURK|nr:porin [Pseudoduganella namucuonensis]SFU43423.1 Outer membrane protein (porin) [Pseudoduganella namucuonensis]